MTVKSKIPEASVKWKRCFRLDPRREPLNSSVVVYQKWQKGAGVSTVADEEAGWFAGYFVARDFVVSRQMFFTYANEHRRTVTIRYNSAIFL